VHCVCSVNLHSIMSVKIVLLAIINLSFDHFIIERIWHCALQDDKF